MMNGYSDTPVRVLLWASDDIVVAPITAALQNIRDIDLVKTTDKGFRAVAAVHDHTVDVVILDIGTNAEATQSAILRLQKADANVRIVMVGSLRFDIVKTSMTHLLEGAAEFVPIPTSYADAQPSEQFSKDLVQVIRALATAQKIKLSVTPRTSSVEPPTDDTRDANVGSYECVLIGSSTGGPHAVSTVLENLPSNFSLPILITQHMPARFTPLFAENLSRNSGRDVQEAQDGERISKRRVYVAPGDYHLTVEARAGGRYIRLLDTPPINFCKPAVDPMFSSASTAYGAAILAIILTGMGQDGTAGAETVRAAGGYVLAQDEASSVVWGMPGAAVRSGHVDAVISLDDMASQIQKLTNS